MTWLHTIAVVMLILYFSPNDRWRFGLLKAFIASFIIIA
jgi:hypothetical protein